LSSIDVGAWVSGEKGSECARAFPDVLILLS
jgi:hypothetical protein